MRPKKLASTDGGKKKVISLEEYGRQDSVILLRVRAQRKVGGMRAAPTFRWFYLAGC